MVSLTLLMEKEMTANCTFLVLTNAVPGREAEFDAWYSERHLPDLLKIPGVRAARRLVLSETQRYAPPYAYRYCALYEIEADALSSVLDRIKAEAGTDAMPLSDAMARERLALIFEPVGAVQHTSNPRPSAASDRSFDARQFRQCLGRYATGVTIMTALGRSGPVGITANSFASLSLDPPLILWSVGRGSRAFDAFARAPAFAVNILSQSQLDLAQRFSSAAADKFEGTNWRPGADGCPLLPGSVAQLECRVEWTADAGDHVLIIGRVNSFTATDADPLLFAQGRFASLAVAEGKPGDTKSVERGGEPRFFFRLLFDAVHGLSNAFEDHRRAEKVTVAQLRMLIASCETPGNTVSDLSRRMLLSLQEAEDAISDLLARGYIRQQGPQVWPTELGVQRRADVARREADFNSEQLAALDPADIQATKRVLKALIAKNPPP